MCSVNFIKGMGIGLIVGSAIGMAACAPSKCNKKKSVVGKALKTMGDLFENISDTFSM